MKLFPMPVCPRVCVSRNSDRDRCRASSPVQAHENRDATSEAAIYTASDFTRLAQGLDAGFTGPATLRVWAPPNDEWRLTEADGIITLSLASKKGDPEPQWRTLGNVTLTPGRPLKIIVARDRAVDGKKEEERRRRMRNRKPSLPKRPGRTTSVARARAFCCSLRPPGFRQPSHAGHCQRTH